MSHLAFSSLFERSPEGADHDGGMGSSRDLFRDDEPIDDPREAQEAGGEVVPPAEPSVSFRVEDRRSSVDRRCQSMTGHKSRDATDLLSNVRANVVRRFRVVAPAVSGRRCDGVAWETQVSACLRGTTPAMTCFVIVCKSVSDLECMPVTFRQDSHRLG